MYGRKCKFWASTKRPALTEKITWIVNILCCMYLAFYPSCLDLWQAVSGREIVHKLVCMKKYQKCWDDLIIQIIHVNYPLLHPQYTILECWGVGLENFGGGFNLNNSTFSDCSSNNVNTDSNSIFQVLVFINFSSFEIDIDCLLENISRPRLTTLDCQPTTFHFWHDPSIEFRINFLAFHCDDFNLMTSNPKNKSEKF